MRSQAQKKADKKYRAKKLLDGTKQQINATLDYTDYQAIDTFCKSNNISKARFIVGACKYFIQRGELPPESNADDKPKA